jgi:DUF4097 and DUF4098 domain-containing protein YvlB
VLAKGVNGPVSIGEVEGPVSVEGVNGSVEVEGCAGRAEVKGVNGLVKLGVARLEGMEVKGVNGNVEVRFRETVNADIDVHGNHGGMTLNLPNVTTRERENFSSMRARIGNGGTPIELRGVNGHILFESDAPASSSSNASTAASAPNAPAAPDAPDEDDAEAPPAPSE